MGENTIKKIKFSDGEMVKERVCEVADTFLEGKQKDERREKIKLSPLSDSTATRTTETLAEDLLSSHLDEVIQNAPRISLAVVRINR